MTIPRVNISSLWGYFTLIDIKIIDKQRMEVLSIIYEVASGSKRQCARMKQIKEWVDIDSGIYTDIIDFWVDEECVARKFEATDVEEYFLTHKGILKVEENLRAKLIPRIKNL